MSASGHSSRLYDVHSMSGSPLKPVASDVAPLRKGAQLDFPLSDDLLPSTNSTAL